MLGTISMLVSYIIHLSNLIMLIPITFLSAFLPVKVLIIVDLKLSTYSNSNSNGSNKTTLKVSHRC